jgi:hypothetical protein
LTIRKDGFLFVDVDDNVDDADLMITGLEEFNESYINSGFCTIEMMEFCLWYSH